MRYAQTPIRTISPGWSKCLGCMNILNRFGIKAAKPIKAEAVRRIMADMNEDITVVVGDREEDILAAKANGCWAIGAAYGYGKSDELKNADDIAENLKEVYRLICKLEESA